jgi:hypothetical protein
MFGRRRRPLMRAAAVGGAGYAIGKRRARAEQEDAYANEPEPQGLGDDGFAELEKLAKLKDRGVLTQEEFDDQKAKILEST